MSRDTPPSKGRWHEAKGRAARPASPTRATARKWAGASTLTALLVAAAALTGWIVWQFAFQTVRAPHLVAIWVGQSQLKATGERAEVQRTRLSAPVPPIPWLDADRVTAEGARSFVAAESRGKFTRELPRAAIEARLASLKAFQPGDALVVYLTAHATVDGEGRVRILAFDSDPFRPETTLPLKDVLARIKACPARNKLLVLDVARNAPDPLDLGGTSDGVPELIRRELQSAEDPKKPNDPDLLVLGTCQGGERSLGSEALGHSTFGHYFWAGLNSPEADTDGDRAVSVKELAGYLNARVDGWARHYRSTRQRPFLAGSGGDFTLAVLTRKPAPGGWSWPWKRARPAAAKSPPDETKPTTEPATVAGKGSPPQERSEPSDGYPPWLAEGWELRDSWRAVNEGQAAPRTVRRLEAVLLRAENLWRSGSDAAPIATDLAAEVAVLGASMRQARVVPVPATFRSVGQARALGWKSDGALASALRKLLTLPTERVDDPVKKEFLAGLKGKTSLDLGAALVDAMKDQPFAPKTLELLDSLVELGQIPRDLIELRFFHRLTQTSKGTPGDGFDATAKQAWEVVVMAEAANSDFESRAWLQAEVERADSRRHDAEVLILPWASGYVPPSTVREAWERVASDYTAIRNVQGKIALARGERTRALSQLHAAFPYVDATDDSGFERAWSDTAQGTQTLDRLLRRPQRPLSGEQASAFGLELAKATTSLADSLRLLEAPFRAREIEGLTAQSAALSSQADPRAAGARLAGRIEALLQTPFPSLKERRALRTAGLGLNRQLAQIPMAGEAPADQETDLASRTLDRGRSRARRLSALVRLAGDEPTAVAGEAGSETGQGQGTGTGPRQDSTQASKSWSDLGANVRLAHSKFQELDRKGDPSDAGDTVGWVAPVFQLDGQRNPVHRVRTQDARAAWAWLAERYMHEGHDLGDPSGPSEALAFYRAAAWEAWQTAPEDARGAGAPPETFVEFAAAPSLSFSPEHTSETLPVSMVLRSPGGAGPQKVTLAVLKPTDDRFRVELDGPPDREVEPGMPVEAKVHVVWAEDPTDRASAQANPRGFILQARLANRATYHLFVPADIATAAARPGLILSQSAARPDDLATDHLRLRPLPGRQPLYVFVKNPGAKPQEWVVEVTSQGGAPAQAKLTVGSGATVPVPGFGGTPPKPEDTLPEQSGPLRITLREAAPPNQVVASRVIDTEIASPEDYLRDYVEVTRARFVPESSAGGKNRLEVTLRARERLTSPCAVELDFSSDRSLFPALKERPKGTLANTLEPGATLTLFAEDLALDPAAQEEGRFFVKLDGLPRALWFSSRFVREGGPQKAVRDAEPRIRLATSYKADPPVATLDVGFLIDNPPAGATVQARLGRVETDRFVDDLPVWTAPAQARHVGFSPHGEGGALLFEATVKDQRRVFEVPRRIGERRLDARLIDPRGREIPGSLRSVRLVLDDQAPGQVGLEVPGQIRKGTPFLDVKGTVVPSASGVQEVVFFLGGKADMDKAKAAGQFVVARPADDSRRVWKGELPLASDAAGVLPVTARFTSGRGLSAWVSQEVTVIAPRPAPVDEAVAAKEAPPEPPAPGSISGKAVEGNRAQPGLSVYLYTGDPDAKDKDKPIASQKTKPDGTFEFKDLKAGPYRVYGLKQVNRRKDLKEVTVEAGKAASVTLDLVNY